MFITLYSNFYPPNPFRLFSGGDYSCLATVEGIELSKEELRGDLVPCGKSEKFRNKLKKSVKKGPPLPKLCFFNLNVVLLSNNFKQIRIDIEDLKARRIE